MVAPHPTVSQLRAAGANLNAALQRHRGYGERGTSQVATGNNLTNLWPGWKIAGNRNYLSDSPTM